MAEAYGKLTGRPGHRAGHARTGRIERRGRHPHGGAGFFTDDRVRRSGRRGFRRSRSVPGNRLSPDVRRAASNGSRRSIAPIAFPNTSRALSSRCIRAARARWCWRCRRTCWSPSASVDDAARVEPTIAASRARTRSPRCARGSSRRAGRWSFVGGSGWSEQRLRRPRAIHRRQRLAGRLRFPQPGPSRQSRRRITRAKSASARIRSLRRACAMPMCCWSSASVWAKWSPRAIRCSACPIRRRR